jgi:hypothetical protein
MSILGITVLSTLKVLRNTAEQNLSITIDNSKSASLYELLKTTNRLSLLYQTVFVVRRIFLAAILIYLKSSKMG